LILWKTFVDGNRSHAYPERRASEHSLSLQVRVARTKRKGRAMLGTVLLIVLILLLIGAFPTWPHSSGWGYGPSGLPGVIVVVLVVLLLMGRI
jgi:hypothetical protein